MIPHKISSEIHLFNEIHFKYLNLLFNKPGLDPAGYRRVTHHHDNEEEALMGGEAMMSDDEKYKDADRFKFVCRNQECKRENIIDGVFSGAVRLALFSYHSVDMNTPNYSWLCGHLSFT